MPSHNHVTIIGNLTRDPEGRRTNSGTAVCTMSVAINRKYRDNNGELQEATVFVDVTAWNKAADFARDYLKKGDPVFISGRLEQESWDDRNTGQKRTKLKVVANEVQALGTQSKPESSSNAQQRRAEANGVTAPPAFQAGPEDDSIDDIPFN